MARDRQLRLWDLLVDFVVLRHGLGLLRATGVHGLALHTSLNLDVELADSFETPLVSLQTCPNCVQLHFEEIFVGGLLVRHASVVPRKLALSADLKPGHVGRSRLLAQLRRPHFVSGDHTRRWTGVPRDFIFLNVLEHHFKLLNFWLVGLVLRYRQLYRNRVLLLLAQVELASEAVEFV